MSIYRRCGCRDTSGQQYVSLPELATTEQKAKACPLMLTDTKHGTWGFYLAAGVDPKTGNRRQLRKSGFATKQAAQKARNTAAVKVDQGTYVKPTTETYGDYLERWLQRRQRTGEGLKPTTLHNYSTYIRNDITPSNLGRMKLTDIRRLVKSRGVV